MKCKICGVEKDNRRAMHGHLIRCHYDDYQRADFLLDRMVTDPVPLAREYRRNKDIKRAPRPDGFRLLRRGNEDEAAAIDAGYDFIDNAENVYTEQEARTEQWI